MRVGGLEIVVVLIIVVLLFGPGRIAKIGSELGTGIRGFKDSLGDDKNKGDTDSDAA